eukprot:PLAT5754.1.p1 GENE.PLAT5754.1~~PLAT5754.1.p1  ORF type:complete len:730 (-),score=274.06 PLAT5754.1:67-1962(-)
MGKKAKEAMAREFARLEDKLTAEEQRYNELMARTDRMRDTINELRRGRALFTATLQSITEEIERVQRSVDEQSEATERCYAARDRAQMAMRELQAEQDRMRSAYQAELQKLTARDEEAVMPSLYSSPAGTADAASRSSGRLMPPTAMSLPSSAASLHRPVTPGSDMRPSTSHSMHSTGGIAMDLISMTPSLLSLDSADPAGESHDFTRYSRQRRLSHMVARAKRFEDRWLAVQRATGVTSPDELLMTFMQVEEKSFSTATEMNALLEDMGFLEEEVRDLKRELERDEGGAAKRHALRMELVEGLEKELASTTRQVDDLDFRNHALESALQALCPAVHKLHDGIGCGRMFKLGRSSSGASLPMMDSSRLLLSSGGVTVTNLSKYLGVIEQRSAEIINAYGEYVRSLPRRAPLSGLSSSATLLDKNAPPVVSALRPATPSRSKLGGADLVVRPNLEAMRGRLEDAPLALVEERPMTREELRHSSERLLAGVPLVRSDSAPMISSLGGTGRRGGAALAVTPHLLGMLKRQQRGGGMAGPSSTSSTRRGRASPSASSSLTSLGSPPSLATLSKSGSPPGVAGPSAASAAGSSRRNRRRRSSRRSKRPLPGSPPPLTWKGSRRNLLGTRSAPALPK